MTRPPDDGLTRAERWSRPSQGEDAIVNALHQMQRNHDEAADERARTWRWFLVFLPVIWGLISAALWFIADLLGAA